MHRIFNKRSASRVLVAVIAAGGAAIGVHSYAGIIGNKLKVNSSAAAGCTISASPVIIGAYRPATAIAPGTPTHNSDSKINVSCTGTVVQPTIFLSAGENGAGVGVAVTRAMRSTKTPSDTLSYQLYQSGGFTSVWGTEAGPGPEGVAPAVGSLRSYTVNALVLVGLTGTKPHNDYTDVVVATFTF